MYFRLLALLSIVFVARTALAQDNSFPYPRSTDAYAMRSALYGNVRDLRGRPVVGARVDVVDMNSGRTITTTHTYGNGSFEFPGLELGRYELVATSGVYESRGRVDLLGDREVTLQLSCGAADVKEQGKTISVSQMKVPGKARKIFNKAMDAFRKARIDDAFGLVQKALGVYPDYAQALTLRGVLKMRKGETSEAQPDLEKAVELDYADDMGFVALASLYNTQKKYAEAAQVLDRGIAIHPDSWQAQMELARAYVGRKDGEAALRALAKCEKRAPSEAHYLHLLRSQALTIQRNYPAAISELESFLRSEPTGENSEPARKMLAQLQLAVAQEASLQTQGTK